MNLLLRLRRHLSTRLAVFIAILFFSATAVEVAPQAIDVMQDLGWLAPDPAEAPAEADALPRPDETVVHSSTIDAVTTVDDAAFDRLVQYAASQPGSFEEPVIYTADVGAVDQDQTDATSLLEGVLSMGGGPAYGSTASPVNRSSPGGSMSVPSSGGPRTATADEHASAEGLTVTTTDEAATDASSATPSAQPEPAGGGRELFFVLNETSKTSDVGQPQPSIDAESLAGPAPAFDQIPMVTLALVPQPEFGTDAGVGPAVSLTQNPEPATLLMLGTGLLFVARYGKRRFAR